MIVIRFKVKCQPAHFDIGRDIADEDCLIATEVFADKAARDRQESLAEVAKVMSVLPQIIAAPPEATVYNVSSAESAM